METSAFFEFYSDFCGFVFWIPAFAGMATTLVSFSNEVTLHRNLVYKEFIY
jgi:hypothetical protein